MITTTAGPWNFTASGSSGSFAINAPVHATAAIGLYAFDPATGSIYRPGYTVALASDLSGATVTVASGLTSGHTVTVYRVAMQTQPQRLSLSGPFPAATVERQLDRAFADIQALRAMVERSVRIALADPAVEELGVELLRAGKVVGFDADGLPSLVSNVPVGSVTITAYMQTALGKSSAAALLTYLGASAYGQTLLAMADAAALRTSLGTAYATALEALTATASDKAVTPAALLGLWQTGTALASNATLDLTAGTDGFQRTISDASNAIATIQGTQPVVRLTAGADGVTLTHHASNLISRTASDIVMRTGDSVTLLRIGTNQWREIGFDPVPNWKSANLTSVGANSTHTVTHYLGNRVGAVRLMGAVKTGQTDNGWADSDFTGNARLEIARATTTNLGWWLFVDDTEVTVRTGSGGIGMIVESSGGTGVALAPAKWNLWLEIDPR